MNSFTTRFLSAVVAVSAVIALFYFFQLNGIRFIIFLVPLLGGLEIKKIIFSNTDPEAKKWAFYIISLILFLSMSINPAQAGLTLATLLVFFICYCLLSNNRFKDIQHLHSFITRSILGFFYVSILPSFAWQITYLDQGLWWFTFLLCVVFAGDIGAYIFGSLWGKTKLIPSLSPKKSLQGSLGGLLASVIAALICGLYNPSVSWHYLVLLAILVAPIAQLGDFYESLLKRIADVKDSGRIMPGHGGVLDRVDGVLFACPIIMLGAQLLHS